MLATIKVHSTLHKYFNDTELRADFNTYYDLVHYLSAMHPRFKHYMDMVTCGESEESYAFLYSNLNLVPQEELHIRRVHEDEVIHLAPMIVGGGGKKGGLLALVAVVGISMFFPPAGGALAGGAGAAGGAAAAGAAGGTGLMGAFSAMPGMASSLFMNVGMSLISGLFSKKKKPMETDTSSRQGGMFGSLTNSTQSGTPIPLHYGLVRVAGQMLSGYIDSDDHGKNDVIRVEDKF